MNKFEQLRNRYLKAQEYFRGRYLTDTPDKRTKAEAAFKELEKQLDEAWEKVKYKSIEVQGDYEPEPFWQPVAVDCYTVSRKIVVRLERPEWWKYADVKEE